jgi:hypothetical protein
MATSAGPDIIEDGLVMHFDANNSNPASYNSQENLITYSNYDPRTWSNTIPQNATLQTNIDAPDGTNTAVRIICNEATGGTPIGYRASLLRINFPNFFANGIDTYTVSFYVRLISGSNSSNGQLTCDFHDGIPGTNYLPSLIRNQWVRITASGIPNAGNKDFFDVFSDNINNYVLDFWGVQLERGSTATTLTPTNGSQVIRTWNDLIGTNRMQMMNATYVGGSNSYFDFNGTSSYCYNYSANNPLINRNTATALIWVYPDTTQPDANYSGMFALGTKSCELGGGNGQTLLFSMQSNRTLTMAKYCDDSFSSIAPAANTWSMVSLVKNGASTRFGINASTFFDASNTGTQNFSGTNLTIGCTDNPGRYYKGRIAAIQLYNRALSDVEIAKNFNALRSRFGI